MNQKRKLKMRSHAETNKQKIPKKEIKLRSKVERSVGGDQVMIRRTQKDIGNNDETMRLFFFFLNAT